MFDTLIVRPFGWILAFCYNLFGSYGVAIILFTIISKIVLLPLQMKSKKSMMNMQRLQPRLDELQKRYGNDKEKYSLAVQKLYKEENVSLFGGCLPMLIMLPIMFGLYYAVRQPFTYMFGASSQDLHDISQLIVNTCRDTGLENLKNYDIFTAYINNPENWTQLEGFVSANFDAYKNVIVSSFPQFAEGISAASAQELSQVSQLIVDTCRNSVNVSSMVSNYNIYNAFIGEPSDWQQLENFVISNFGRFKDVIAASFPQFADIDFTFMFPWFDLAKEPTLRTATPDPLLIIPVLSGITSWFSSWIMRRGQAKPANPQKSNGIMNVMMPLMSLWIAFVVPAGLGLYWIISNLFSAVQEPLLTMYYKKKMLNNEIQEAQK